MSENVEIVRRNLRAWQRDDFEAFLLGTHPEIEWHAVLERLVEGPESKLLLSGVRYPPAPSYRGSARL